MLFAAIDIGSNAVRLYFANAFNKNNTVVIEKASLIRIPVRLGEDVFNTGVISDEKRKNLLQTMAAFSTLIDVYKPLNYMACATSAMREAVNGAEIIDEIKLKTGLDISIIDGTEEARILCTLDCFNLSIQCQNTMFVDVGGGSTEISVARNHQRIISESFRIGTLRILFNKDEAREWLRMNDFLLKLKADFPGLCCIGSGGNINKLAKIYGHYQSHTISYKQLLKGYEQIRKTPLKERIEKMGMRPDRADVIEPAAQIFIKIAETIGIDTIYVPKIGLIDGLIHLLYEAYTLNEKK